MKIELQSVPFKPNEICSGKPSPAEFRGCTNAVKAISEPTQEASVKVLVQPAGPPPTAPATTPAAPASPPADRPQEQPLGFTPKALIARANNNQLSEPQTLGFAPRALIARANNSNLQERQPAGNWPSSPPRTPASSAGKNEPAPKIPTFAEWYDSRYDDDDSDSAGFINNKMARRWLYDELYKDKK